MERLAFFAAKGRAANDHTQRGWFCFTQTGETKLPVARVVVYDTILFLNIFMNMPSSLPAKFLEETLKGMKCDIKFKYRLAESYKSLQLLVSLRFSTPRHNVYCKIWV